MKAIIYKTQIKIRASLDHGSSSHVGTVMGATVVHTTFSDRILSDTWVTKRP